MTDLNFIAKIVCQLYTHPFIQNFRPGISKGRPRNRQKGELSKPNSSEKSKHAIENNNFCSMWINPDLTSILNHEPLDQLLKKVIISNIPNETIVTQNGIDKEELKKGINILKSQINSLLANQQEHELKEKQETLAILEEKYNQCLKEGNFEKVINYRAIVGNALNILANDDSISEKLYILINHEFGHELTNIRKTKKEFWEKKWADYEENREHIKLSSDEEREYQEYLIQKERTRRKNEYSNNHQDYQGQSYQGHGYQGRSYQEHSYQEHSYRGRGYQGRSYQERSYRGRGYQGSYQGHEQQTYKKFI